MKSRLRLRNRRAVLDAGIIILGAIVAIIAIIAATLAWSDILEVSFVKLMTEMPRFGYDTQEGHESGNQNFEIYQILRNISLIILILVMMFAGLSFIFEHINLVPPETGYQILSKSVIYVFFFFFFPPIWDLIAAIIEQTSLWILNPDDPTQPTKHVEFLLTKLSMIDSPEFTLDSIVAGISNPFSTLKNMFLTTFLSVFKAIAFLIFMFLAFLFGTIRVVLTAIVTAAIPIILMLSLIPFFRRIINRFIDALLGLIVAPIFSALVIAAGVAHLQTLESSSPDPMVEWFSALAVMALATFMPAMIVPMLGSVVGSVSSVIGRAVSTGAMISSMAGLGLTRSLGGSFSSMMDQSESMSGVTDPLSLAKLAFSGSNVSTTKSSLNEIGTTLSESVTTMQGPLSRLKPNEMEYVEYQEPTYDLHDYDTNKQNKSDKS